MVLAAADYVAVAKRAILSAAAFFPYQRGKVAIRTHSPMRHFPFSFLQLQLGPCATPCGSIFLCFLLCCLPDYPLAFFLSSQLFFVAFNAA